MTVSFLGHLTSSPEICKKKQCVHYSIMRDLDGPSLTFQPILKKSETIVLSVQFSLISNTPQGQSGGCNRDSLNYYNHT